MFKVFKSEGGIGRTRSANPWRVLAELYAKLLAMVVQQWALLAAGYVMLRHSARKAARRVRRRAASLLACLGRLEEMGREVARLARELHRHCRIASRRRSHSTLDRLTTRDPRFDQPKEVEPP